MRRTILRHTYLLASGAFVVGATAALAGSGVGGVFNLGQVNTVNARTQLQGTTVAQELYVINTSTSASSIAALGRSDAGTGLWGQAKSGSGVRAVATGTTGANYGLYATTASYAGLGGFFRNTGTTPDLTYGTALRALGAGATGNEINRRNHAAAAGEFIGYVGVTGASSLADGGAGVLALSGAGDYGIYAISDSEDGYAGFFQNSSSINGTAIRALSSGATGGEFGTYLGTAGGQFAGPLGVLAASSSSGGIGVLAVQGEGNYALVAVGATRVNGDLIVTGTLHKGAGTFKIDHPLDPENKYLSHSFVESPDMMNIYNGNVVTDAKGTAVIALPGYFEALNRDPRYQLTVIGTMAQAIVDKKIAGNRFSIRTSEPNVEVSWQVTGIRQDGFAKAHPVIVEEEKSVADRGRYLHPTELGMPASLGINRDPQVASVAPAAAQPSGQ